LNRNGSRFPAGTAGTKAPGRGDYARRPSGTRVRLSDMMRVLF
jgi:hypothetical protein